MSDSNSDLIINDSWSLLNTNQIGKEDLKRYEIDTLIQKAGGFGLLQWWLMFYAIIASQGINYFMFNFQFLELVPSVLCKYTAQSDYVKCDDFKDIWVPDKVYEWKVDYDDKYSFHNWITDYELYCISDFMIGLFGWCMFAGMGLMGLGLRLADVYGRK